MGNLSIEFHEPFETAKEENIYLEENLKQGYHLITVASGIDPINLENKVTVYYWLQKEGPRMYMRVTHIVLLPGEEYSFLTSAYLKGSELISSLRGKNNYVSHYFKTKDQQLLGVR